MNAVLTAVAVLSVLSGTLEGNAEFQAGQAFYQELELEQALLKFRLASASPDLSAAERAVVVNWIAMTYGSMGDDAAARQSFADAFALDVEAPLPELLPPTLREIAEVERGKAREAQAAAAAAAAADEATAPDGLDEPEAVDARDAVQADAAGAAPGGGGLPWLLIVGGGVAAVAALAVAGAVGAGAVGALGLAFASDPTNFQSDADAAVLSANVAFSVAGGLGFAALALLATGATVSALELVVE